MIVTLTKELESLVQEKVRSGRYADASDVVRDALRRMEQDDGYEAPELEAALLEGVRSPHRKYGKAVLGRIRKGAAMLKK
jgi:antitoxin ParD1/3/4